MAQHEIVYANPADRGRVATAIQSVCPGSSIVRTQTATWINCDHDHRVALEAVVAAEPFWAVREKQ